MLTRRLVKRSALVFISFTAMLCAQQANAACTSAQHRMAEINGYQKTDDTLVLAHRGYWGKYNHDDSNVPENSIASAKWANTNCMDGIELDIKESKDGVLYLMHDFNLGRTTDIWRHTGGRQYDPQRNDGSNPAVNSMAATDIDQLSLLVPDRSKASDQRVPRVSHLLETWTNEKWSTPIIFDTKTTSAVKMLDSLVKGLMNDGINVVGVKVNATLYPTPAAFYRDTSNLQVIPVFTTNMLGKIDVPQSAKDWMGTVKTLEINIKQHGGLLSTEKDNALEKGLRVGAFQAIPDGPGENQFYKNTGQCCYKLSDMYYKYYVNGRLVGEDTDDRRGDIRFLVDENIGLITSDDPESTVRYLARVGKRKNHYQGYWG